MYARPLGIQPIVETTDAAGTSLRLRESEARLLLLEQQLDRDAGALDDATFAAREVIETHEDEASLETHSETVFCGTFVSMLRSHPTLVFSGAATVLVVLVIPLIAIAFASSLLPPAGLLTMFDRSQGIIDIAPRCLAAGSWVTHSRFAIPLPFSACITEFESLPIAILPTRCVCSAPLPTITMSQSARRCAPSLAPGSPLRR